MNDLIAWLRAQLDNDEQVARAAASQLRADPGAQMTTEGQYVARHVARWDPARVLAEVEAKRRILAWLAEVELSDGTTWSFDGDGLLELLAQPYAAAAGDDA